MGRAGGFRNRAPRIDVRRTAVMIDSTDGAHEITILDISSGRFRIEATEAPRIGEFIVLRVEHDAEFRAQIRWALGNEAGGIFLTDAGSEGMGERQMADEEDRRSENDRRKSDRRKGNDRRQIPRAGDRREEDRRA